MWLLAGGMFALAKTAMLAQTAGLNGWRGWAFMLAWPGMNPGVWVDPKGKNEKNLPWHAGMASMTAGAFLIWGAARCWTHPLVAGWTGMIGMVLMLHFGLFRVLAGFWQRNGVPVHPLMDAPLRAVTVAEFWGRRWNRAFRDLSQSLLGRPLARRWGAGVALWGVFLVSGLAHEVVISVPAGAGYGLPTAYFALQAGAIVTEKRLKLRGHLWTIAVIALPALFLFHPPFVERVILPFLTTLGALPCAR
jgi:alginate O-acetyltransferase complex protein AlgI